jgi:hypothetical protein
MYKEKRFIQLTVLEAQGHHGRTNSVLVMADGITMAGLWMGGRDHMEKQKPREPGKGPVWFFYNNALSGTSQDLMTATLTQCHPDLCL